MSPIKREKTIPQFSWLDDPINSKAIHEIEKQHGNTYNDRKINLLFIINTNIAAGGGMERVLLRYLQEIPSNKKGRFRITVIQTGNMDQRRIDEKSITDIFTKADAELITLDRLNSNSLSFKNALFATVMNTLTEGFRNRKEGRRIKEISRSFDVVYLFRNSFIKFIGNGPRVIGSFHERNLNPRVYRFPGRLLISFAVFLIKHRIIWRRINAYHYIARNLSDFMPANAFFIPNGVKLDNLSESPERKSGKKTRILFVGRLIEEKGIRILLEAFSILKDYENYELNIVGGGELEDFIKSYKKDGIVYHGVVSDNELNSIYEQCDVFVFPTHADTFGLVILEALYHGEYVIADKSLSGVFDEFMNIGMLEYVETNAEKIAERIAAFRHKDLGDSKENARRLIDEKYRWDIVCRDLYSVIEKIA